MNQYCRKFSLKKIPLSQPVDVRPLTFTDTAINSQLIALRLGEEIYREKKYPENFLTIGIQKGTNILDMTNKVCLYCCVSIYSHNFNKSITRWSTIRLPDELRVLVKEKGMELYTSYEKIYGEKVKDSSFSIYEQINPQLKESSWIGKTLIKTIHALLY
jgi:hypothetical protein